eukprot:gene2515-2819_t
MEFKRRNKAVVRKSGKVGMLTEEDIKPRQQPSPALIFAVFLIVASAVGIFCWLAMTKDTSLVHIQVPESVQQDLHPMQSSLVRSNVTASQLPYCPNPCYTLDPTQRDGCSTRPQQRDALPAGPFPVSFWLVKTFKTGSSTLAGVFRSISSHYGIVPISEEATRQESMINVTVLAGAMKAARHVSYADNMISIVTHLPYREPVFEAFRDITVKPPHPLLFTTIRNPVSRVYSSYVQDACMKIARQELGAAYIDQCGGQFGGDDSIMRKALANDTEAARWAYIKAHPKNVNYNFVKGNAQGPRQALDKYNFTFVVERMEESLVVFMLEFGLEWRDIVHLSSKVRTGRYKTAKDMPAAMNSYIEEANSEEMALWRLANQQLDQKIEALGLRCGGDVLPSALETYRQLQQHVNKACGDFKGWYKSRGFAYPYAHFGDQGLGPRCIQHILMQYLNAL